MRDAGVSDAAARGEDGGDASVRSAAASGAHVRGAAASGAHVRGAAASRAHLRGAAASCLYEGTVRHRRMGSVPHEFRHPLFMAYLDLAELPQLFDGVALWSARRPAPAWFRRADHVGDRRVPLDVAVRELVRERAGVEVDGPIRLLTHLRYFGHCFNPVSFYYCFGGGGAGAGGGGGGGGANETSGEREREHVRAVVAHVTNTPWGDSHSYVMRVEAGHAVMRERFDKELHVSPFMGMDHTYDWRLTEPGERLLVHIDSLRDGEKAFDATLTLHRRQMTPAALRSALLRYPLMTLRVSALIYGHALRLRLKGARWFSRPEGARAG